MRKPRKYRNVPTVVDGIRFDSKAEARRWGELKLLERAGSISSLERQVAIELPGIYSNGRKAKMIVDFVYWDRTRAAWVHEDVKGYEPTTVWKLKQALVRFMGIEVEVVR